jgi:hypothetical protein
MKLTKLHNNIPVSRRKPYNNLIKFTKQLTKIMPGDKKAIDRLKEEVESADGVASMTWLKEKIAEME